MGTYYRRENENNKQSGIYCIINEINGKKYIGITKYKPEDRWQNGYGYKKQIFFKAIKKYGWDGFEHKVLFENLSKEEACNKEIELIALYKTNDKKYGYNISRGGDDGHNELWNDEEYRNNQIVKLKERWKNPEYSNKMKQIMHQVFQNQEYKDKQSKNTFRRWEDGEFDSIHCKQVMCLETGEIYKSITDASKITNIYRGDIGKCCLEQMKTANGYHWIYYNGENYSDEERDKIIKKIGKGKCKQITCVETGKVYDSIKEAAIDVGIDNSILGKAVKDPTRTACGFSLEIL